MSGICPSNQRKPNTDVSNFSVEYCEPKKRRKLLDAQHKKKHMCKTQQRNAIKKSRANEGTRRKATRLIKAANWNTTKKVSN
jgi:hypothetical protein